MRGIGPADNNKGGRIFEALQIHTKEKKIEKNGQGGESIQ